MIGDLLAGGRHVTAGASHRSSPSTRGSLAREDKRQGVDQNGLLLLWTEHKRPPAQRPSRRERTWERASEGVALLEQRGRKQMQALFKIEMLDLQSHRHRELCEPITKK